MEMKYDYVYGSNDSKQSKPTKRNQEPIERLVKVQSSRLKNRIAISPDNSVAIVRLDGTVISTGGWDFSVAKWQDVIAIYAGVGGFFIGLTSDGKVVRTTDYAYEGNITKIDSWRNIIAIAIGSHGIMGLKLDGTVEAVSGLNTRQSLYGGDIKKNENRILESWKDIIAISSYMAYGMQMEFVGLKSDGVVVAANPYSDMNITLANEISSFSTSCEYTENRNVFLSLKKDGTPKWLGNESKSMSKYFVDNKQDWCDIVTLSHYSSYNKSKYISNYVGLTATGTVVSTLNDISSLHNTTHWYDIVAISAGSEHTVGLKTDGTVLATGSNHYGECDTMNWNDIVAIYSGNSVTYGLKADGKVVAVGNNHKGLCNVSEDELWVRRQNQIEMCRAHEQFLIEQQNKWKRSGRCEYCGGVLSGLIIRRCKRCESRRNT